MPRGRRAIRAAFRSAAAHVVDTAPGGAVHGVDTAPWRRATAAPFRAGTSPARHRGMRTATILLLVIGALGAFDIAWFHTHRAHLTARRFGLQVSLSLGQLFGELDRLAIRPLGHAVAIHGLSHQIDRLQAQEL